MTCERHVTRHMMCDRHMVCDRHVACPKHAQHAQLISEYLSDWVRCPPQHLLACLLILACAAPCAQVWLLRPPAAVHLGARWWACLPGGRWACLVRMSLALHVTHYHVPMLEALGSAAPRHQQLALGLRQTSLYVRILEGGNCN